MYETLFDAEARIAALYAIHGIGDPDSPPGWVQNLLEDISDKDLANLMQACPELAPVAELTDFDNLRQAASAWAEQWSMADRSGYIVETEVCVRTYVGGGDAYYSGWGHYRNVFIFVADASDATSVTLKIANEIHDRSKADAKAGAA